MEAPNIKKLPLTSVLLVLLCLILLGLVSGCGKKPQYTLTIGVDGNGEGTVQPAPGMHTYEENTVVALKATPAVGSLFAHWGGTDGTSVSSANTIVMKGNKSVKAIFTEAKMEITTQPIDSLAGQPAPGLPTIKVSTREEGKPIPNVAISVVDKDGQPFQGTKTVLTNDAGLAVFDNLIFYEGIYELVFSTNNLSNVESSSFTVQMAGAGDATNPYLIHNLYGLMAIEQDLDACYRIENDIDASATADPTFNGGKGWMPIGQVEPGFTGQINGNGKTISGLHINRPDEDFIGFIKSIRSGVRQVLIKDLHLASVNMIGQGHVGGLIGGITANHTSQIKNCSVTGQIAGKSFVGGMFGDLRGIATNCDTDTIVVSGGVDAWYTGGLAGYAGSATITSCFAFGSVTGHYSVGGLLGTADDCSISQCYAATDVNSLPGASGTSMFGGFAGWLNAGNTVADCYSIGNVNGKNSVGGFCGSLQDSAVARCYSAGTVTSSDTYGGFTAHAAGAFAITNCYYDSDTSRCSDTSNGEPMTTAEMKDSSNYSGWDFAAMWNISATVNDGYPYLRNTPTE